jgi:hypothetical protein
MRLSKVFCKDITLACKSHIEIERCRCRHCRVTQERLEVLRKVISQSLQMPEQHNQLRLIPQIVRFNLELDWCQRCGHLCHLHHTQSLKFSKLVPICNLGVTQKTINIDHGLHRAAHGRVPCAGCSPEEFRQILERF